MKLNKCERFYFDFLYTVGKNRDDINLKKVARKRKSSHEALLARQDAEIRLLENMRRCLILRVKCDREYAVALSSVVIQAQKFDKGDDLSGSLVARAWRTMIDETETFSKLVKKNADALSSENIEELSSLVCEKRNWRKNYNEERYQMISKLSVCLDMVNKAKSHYERCLDNYKVGKQKYEESCAKNKGPKKSDEAKEKFLRCCKRLHLAHNDYVLSLCEATNYERDLRSILLPGLLEYQQSIQEQGIKLWKDTLENVVHKTSFCTNKFQENYAKIKCSVEDINPHEEYSEFIDTCKSLPRDPVTFQFDAKLLGDSPSKLLPNTIVVDDLTIDELKKKMADLDIKLKECLSEIKETNSELVKFENHLAAIRKSSSTATRAMEMKHNVDILTKKLCKLKCQEESLQKQLDLISAPILDLGCEEAPAGCELKTDSPEAVNNEPVNIPAPSNSTSTINRKQTQKIVEMICKPFTRKPSIGNIEDEASDKELVTCNAVRDEAKYTNKYQIFFSHPERPLVDEDWFHGVLPREDVTRLLVNDGDFLVRETTRHDERLIVLSVCWSGHRHFIIQSSGTEYRFEGPSFPTIQELINYQFESGNPVTTKSGAILKTPILREGWELHNDDVILTDKIGRGNFGDVYKGKLKTTNIDVAVKICRHTRAEEQKKKFLQEGRILKQYDHPNIVKLIGICVQKQPVMIVMELVPGGSLLAYLKKYPGMLMEFPNRYPLKMCRDVADGMAYLESRGCIHRDLAARNCLIGHSNTVKISDFGMSREEEEYVVSNGMKEIPIKWTAPEALNFGVYTSACDVWSYGILCWEIFSLGQTPYSGYSNTQARELIESGYRMPSPAKCLPAMYDLMLKCWSYNPKDRPNFVSLLKRVESLIEEL